MTALAFAQPSTDSPVYGDDLVELATSIAIDAHYGQVDKSGDPYIFHPLAVAGLTPHAPGFTYLPPAYRPLAIAAGLLHDVVEDTAVTLDDLAARGIPGRLLEVIDALTHRPHEPLDDYYARIKDDPIAVVVKLADVKHNSSPDRLAGIADEATRERLARKYEKAWRVLSA